MNIAKAYGLYEKINDGNASRVKLGLIDCGYGGVNGGFTVPSVKNSTCSMRS